MQGLQRLMVGLTFLVSTCLFAQGSFPNKPVTLIVP
ncbi:MAG: hypothetical protein RL442_2763, partial [Pseudomonadota bacterium]